MYKVSDIFVRFLLRRDFSQHISMKMSSITFRENPSSGSRFDAWGQTWRICEIV